MLVEKINQDNCRVSDGPKGDNLGCDQIAWLIDILERYREITTRTLKYPSVSRMKEMATYAAVLEISEIVGLKIEDHAIFNITPRELRGRPFWEETMEE